MHRYAVRAAVVVASALAVPASGVGAQSRIEVTPHVGMYVPLRPVVQEVSTSGELRLRRRQLGAAMVGGRVALRATTHFQVEGAVHVSPSSVAVTDETQTFDAGGAVILASTRLVYLARPKAMRGANGAIHLAVGGGVIERFGGAWRGIGGTQDFAMVLGGGARWSISRHPPITIKLEVEDYVSRAQFRDHRDATTRPRLSHDTVWSMGLILATGR